MSQKGRKTRTENQVGQICIDLRPREPTPRNEGPEFLLLEMNGNSRLAFHSVSCILACPPWLFRLQRNRSSLDKPTATEVFSWRRSRDLRSHEAIATFRSQSFGPPTFRVSTLGPTNGYKDPERMSAGSI